MVDVGTLDVLAQKASLEVLITQLDVIIKTSEEEMRVDRASIDTINRAVVVAKKSPYNDAINGKDLTLAIVPYGSTPVNVGTPVFDCFLGMVACHNVGKVTAVYTNEQVFEHPILRINMRGYIVKIDVQKNAVKSKTLIVGGKPFLF